jgi:1,4-dihydroxy-2-naphthoate polyprenyltransferase
MRILMIKPIAIWWQACRFHFVPPSTIPAILGSAIAWATTGVFYPFLFLLTVLGVMLNHIALNMTDDYFDYMNSVDQAKQREKNPYSGGSGTLTTGLITPHAMFIVLMALYSVTIGIGVYLTLAQGWPVLLFGIFGMVSAYFYTAPPIRYGYHGLGEISQLINFSLTIGLGAHFVQAGQYHWQTSLSLLPLGLMMFAMITINELPDEADDRAGNKHTLVVIFGKAIAIKLYAASMILAFLIIFISPMIGIASFWSYLALITFPWFVQAAKIAFQNYRDPVSLAPANILTIKIHNLTGIILIISYIIEGRLSRGMSAAPGWLLAALVVSYAPVFFTVFIPTLPVKPAEKFVTG